VDNFLNHLKAQAAQMDQGWAQPRLAVVQSVDPATFTVRVSVQPEGVLTGWLPVTSAWVGAGWGLACLPSTGDQVLVIWQEGDAEHGIVVGRLWSNMVQPPQAPVGEFWLVHKTGSFLKLHNDGSIESSGSPWMHTGDLRVSGDVYDQHGSVAALREHFNTHVHPPSSSGPTPID
jgi:phage baseplate assembly protein gpV